MKISVRFFAVCRELTGSDHFELECEEGLTVAEAASLISEKYPQLNTLKNTVRYAVDDEYADNDYILKNGQEISMIPPVSGG